MDDDRSEAETDTGEQTSGTSSEMREHATSEPAAPTSEGDEADTKYRGTP